MRRSSSPVNARTASGMPVIGMSRSRATAWARLPIA